MMINNVMHLIVFMLAIIWQKEAEAATKPSAKFCGRYLSEIMSRICHSYNGPSWDIPRVEQPGGVVRRKRQLGIADQCCLIGCTLEQLSEYCSIIAYSESPLEELESHIIEDRSAEKDSTAADSTTKTSTVPTPAVDILKNSVRAAPVVGTVSPLITWGRTVNTDFPRDSNRYAYVVYT